MADIALTFTDYGGGDLVLSGQDLLRDDGLESAVLLSLFTDLRARPEQLLPEDDKSDLRGYWGDVVPAAAGDKTGSLLWLLRREKQTAETLARAKQYCEQALAWLIEDKVASVVTVATQYIGAGMMRIDTAITRPGGNKVQYRYDFEWAAQAAKRTA